MIILSFSPTINRVKESHFPLSMHALSLRRKNFSAQCWSDQGMMMMMMMIMTIMIIKKRKYNSRVTEIEQGTFTPLVFTTTGGMADECLRYHSRLAELLSVKKQESYATTISWVRAKVSFAILRSVLLCLRGSRTPRRRNFIDVKDRDLEIEKGQAGPSPYTQQL